MDDLDELYNIESRQRKEKKELQAQITALKKAAKNDKSKKKELIAEICRLESDQEAKHNQELKEFKKNQDSIQTSDVEIIKTKISKAQRRRDKISQQEREREENIKLQERENLNGPRNAENQSIVDKLQKRHLKLFSITSDGDCLYNAISHQMEITRHVKLSVEELRDKVANYIRENKEDFYPFMSNPDSYGMLTDEEFENYCDKIKNTKVWGGQLEIKALSNLLKCPINIIQAPGPDSIEQGTEFDGEPLIITYHRHMYHLGEHYNSTVQLESTEANVDT